MSTAKVINLVHPSGSTNNLVLDSSGNVVGGGTIADSTAILRPRVLGTAQASTSGTSIPFTGIPSWAKRITFILNGVSTNGTNNLLLQIGTGGVATTSGYVSQSTILASSSGTSVSSTVGFVIFSNLATDVFSGLFTIVNVSGNTWVFSGVIGATAPQALSVMSSGTVALSGVLDNLRLIASSTGSPADTFDAGSVNIMYE